MDARHVEGGVVPEEPTAGDVELTFFEFAKGDEDGDGAVGEEVFRLDREKPAMCDYVGKDERLARWVTRAGSSCPVDDGNDVEEEEQGSEEIIVWGHEKRSKRGEEVK